jgi:hypothetical protein
MVCNRKKKTNESTNIIFIIVEISKNIFFLPKIKKIKKMLNWIFEN